MKHGARFSVRAGMGGVAALAAALLGLGACSNPIAHVTTERAIGNAFGEVLSQPGINLRFSLGVTAQQLLQIGRIEGGKGLTPQVASALSRASTDFNVQSGHGESLKSKQFATDHSNEFEMAFQVGNATPVDIRYLTGTLYAQADISALLTDFGQSPSRAATFQRGLQKADSYLSGLAALGEGKWVSANLSAFGPLLKQIESKNGSAASNKYQAEASNLLNHIRAALKSNSTYANAGDHGGRTEYELTVQAHNFVHQLTTILPADISNLVGSTPVASANSVSNQVTKGLDQAAAKIPANQTVVLQLWVKNNRAEEVDLDINQFVHKFPFAVPLRIEISPGPPVVAPSGATPLDFSNISQQLGGLLSGAGASSR